MKKDTLIGWGVIGAAAILGTVVYKLAKDEKVKEFVEDTKDKIKEWFE